MLLLNIPFLLSLLRLLLLVSAVPLPTSSTSLHLDARQEIGLSESESLLSARDLDNVEDELAERSFKSFIHKVEHGLGKAAQIGMSVVMRDMEDSELSMRDAASPDDGEEGVILREVREMEEDVEERSFKSFFKKIGHGLAKVGKGIAKVGKAVVKGVGKVAKGAMGMVMGGGM
ncbi:hypothetical protein DACRYDRAFT_111339 [Dacryopinax primogenitus]|uniref:Uncharacterized protein n=1 Tax=Dacryopinax primogenitus (strain DJM 731) TaxID=1858805 RepID=M5FWM0_DACPD|nr:uncharacterized protein DACRYDRAFT_111339 [Dacryopinax primogenitus]EJT97821.1 hypothetical protein DACRYDRAFT_111339 [Dacryopinax primogenitus]